MDQETKKIRFSDAIKLWRKYLNLFNKAKSVNSQLLKEEKKIKNLSNKLLEEQVNKAINSTPIDELSKQKRGIKVSAYKNAGYHTIGDVIGKRATDLTRIYGIGEVSANETVSACNVIATKIRNITSLELKTNSLDYDSYELIKAIAKYRRILSESKYSEKLIHKEKKEINRDVFRIVLGSTSMAWALSNTVRKEALVDKFNELTEKVNGELLKKIDEEYINLHKVEEEIKTLDADEELKNESASTFATLDKINPKALGNDAGLYDLQNETLEAIKNQDINLDGLNCTLFRYQELGVKYILHQGNVMLGDEMGLGKTIQAIASMVSLRNAGFKYFMVICPASVFVNWQREITKFSDLKVYPLYGKDIREEFNKWIKNGDVGICTYESVDKIFIPNEISISLMTVDEAHNIKHSRTKRATNIHRIEKSSNKILYLSGTPLENNVQEMIELINHLDSDVAREAERIYQTSSDKSFRMAIASVYYRRKLRDVAKELPDKTVVEEWCILNENERRLYEYSVINKQYMDARRLSWNIHNIEESAKATRLFEILEEAKQEGRKTIVFSFFLDTINFIKENIEDNCYGPINGSISVEERQHIIDDFTNAPDGSVLLSQIQAGGTGLNIQSANVVVICEPQLKPSIENQAVARAHRIGQTSNVFVHRLLCSDTIEERIYEVLKLKQEQFDLYADKSESAENDLAINTTTINMLFDEESKKITSKSNIKQT